ncbi:MAG: DMT family transporter [Calditrichaeota bacterium]|nr:DMT family transporter [Calditrichota bacterium]
MSINQKAVVVLGFGLMAISVASVLIKICAAPALVIAVYRLGLASIFYLTVNRISRKPLIRNLDSGQIKVILISAVFLTIHFATWITSLKFTSVASSVVLVQSSPIFVAIGSIIFLKEKPSGLMILGIVFALIGGVIISVHDFSLDENSLTGNLLAIGGAIGAAGYLLSGRHLRKSLDTFQYVAVLYSITTIFLLVLAVGNGADLIHYDWRIFALFAAIAFFPQVIGHTSFNWALAFFSATAVSIVALGEPIGASILAYFFLGEKLTFVKIIGGVIILIGVTMAIISEGRAMARTRNQIP